ncbi:rab11 family-interacting protein 1-like [Podarcis raffonei]|uniref:rab11 family-interacting protein 1-like n=1 Tax=Podarcis raffonei TaxID=65483 RepID=UPI002329851B|nr:rab11 family-interacting protein 1-like [Podarcis raffonei]
MVEWEPTLMASLIGQLCILSCIQLRSRLFGRICLGSCGAFQGVRRWYKLRSKPGKKEKERGEIEVDIQFMRSNMTASMFDLPMKDKSRTPFGKLKDKLKGKREPSTNEGHRRGHSSDKSSTADLRITKASLNHFDENISAEEKPEKNSASVKPSQTKPVKPRWCKLHFKPTTLSVIPEEGSDDEQLSDYPQGTEKIALSGDLSRSGDCKSSAKNQSITSKILDNQNEADIKKYDPSDPAYAYGQLTHSELIQLVLKQKDVIAKRDQQVRELEDYIDNLLVRVMEETLRTLDCCGPALSMTSSDITHRS